MPKEATFRRIEECVKNAKVAEYSQRSRYEKGWSDLWQRVRLKCRDCDATVVYYSRGHYAFCSDRCGFSMKGPKYRGYKGEICRILLEGEEGEPPWPYILVDSTTKSRGKRRNDPISGEHRLGGPY